MRSSMPRTSRPEVEWVGKECPWEGESSDPCHRLHVVISFLANGMPRVVILHMTVVGVMCPVGDAPSMVGDEDGGVDDVAD